MPVSTLGTKGRGAEYRRLLAVLSSRARRLGSRDPESAAQETLKRSLEHACSQTAVAYYFGQDPRSGDEPPEWPLDQLLAWLHGVLYYVVREEHSRASNRREISLHRMRDPDPGGERGTDPADPSPDPLAVLIDREMQEIVSDCFPKLERDYRTVLALRADGLKYGEIANRLGVNENTVATWVSRGIRDWGRFVRERTERLISMPRRPEQ